MTELDPGTSLQPRRVKVLLRNCEDPRHEDHHGDANPLPYIDQHNRVQRKIRIPQPIWSCDSKRPESRVDHSHRRLHERAECDPHSNRADQRREENDASEKPFELETRGQQHGKR